MSASLALAKQAFLHGGPGILLPLNHKSTTVCLTARYLIACFAADSRSGGPTPAEKEKFTCKALLYQSGWLPQGATCKLGLSPTRSLPIQVPSNATIPHSWDRNPCNASIFTHGPQSNATPPQP